MLHPLAIEPARQLERLRIGNLIARDHPGPHRAETVHALGKGRLRRRDIELEFAGAHIIQNRVTGNHRHRLFTRYAMRELTDHHRQFDLEIELGDRTRRYRHTRADHT